MLASVLMIITGVATLQLGSYFQAREHMAVLSRISWRTLSWILDIATIITLFAIGFVMFAGGGSNLEQQFGLPTWVGAAIMLALVLVTGMLDVDKVSAIIGGITPAVIVLVLGVGIYTLTTTDPDFAQLAAQANEVSTTLPNWWISALNYVGLSVMTAVSMSIVIGGNFLDTKVAGLGGLLGGLFFLVMLMLLVLSLYFKVPVVSGADMPVLELVNAINPIFGVIMTIVVYGMIFNTAIGMFYALGKRLTRNNPGRYRLVFIGTVLIGFALSFIGFKSLVSYVYPTLGYLGILMIVVISVAWIRGMSKMTKEGRRRLRARDLTRRRMDPRLRFTKRQEKELARLTAASNLPDEDFKEQLAQEVSEQLENDDSIDYDPADPPAEVTYVAHTEPTVPGEKKTEG